jgi:hypothetical protein
MRQIDWVRLWLRKSLLMILKVSFLSLLYSRWSALVMLLLKAGPYNLLIKALKLSLIFFGSVLTLILEESRL